MSRERRRDPRTNHLYSLRNLLRVSARKFQIPLLVLGTPDDVVIAASEESTAAQEGLLRGSTARRVRIADHSRIAFEAQGKPLVLVACGRPSGSAGLFPGFLESVLLRAIANRIEAIFSEPVRPPLPMLAGASA